MLYYLVDAAVPSVEESIESIEKSGIEGEVIDLVNTMEKETAVGSIALTVYKHLEAKKPDSFWIVGVIRDSTAAHFAYNSTDESITSFINYNLGTAEDRDGVVFELEHPHDEVEAKKNVLNENWVKEVKSAYLTAQMEKDEAEDIEERATQLLPELNEFQRIILSGDEFIWSWKSNNKLIFFCENIGDWLVVLVPAPKRSASSDSLSSNFTKLQVNEQTGNLLYI